MGITKGIRILRALIVIFQAIQQLKKKSGKVYSIKKGKEDYTLFYRSLIYHNLKKDSFFEYLNESHTQGEIMKAKGYIDNELLKIILNVFVLDGILIHGDTDKEQCTYKTAPSLPEILKEGEIPVSLEDVGYAYMEQVSHLTERLKGKHITFAIDSNIFNWIGGFRNIMYPTVTKGSLAYCSFLGKKVRSKLKKGNKVRILDAGSGDGRNTIIIWDYFRKKGCFFPGADIEFHGVDYSKDFIKIANFEVFNIVKGVLKSTDKNFFNLNNEEQERFLYVYEPFFPSFKQGNVENLTDIPNDYYDVVFTSNTLHWTNMKKSLPELLRITKPGGVIFGQGKQKIDNPASTLEKKQVKGKYPDILSGEYSQVIFNIVNPEATGFPYVDEFRKIAKDNGAKYVEVGFHSVGFFLIVNGFKTLFYSQ